MKTRFVFLMLIVLTTLLSCKDNKQETKATSEINNNDQFKVTLNLIAKNEDDYCLLYTQDGSISFRDEVVYQHLNGSENEQQLFFELPKDAYPTQLRFDFGLKKKLDEVIIKSIVCEYKGNRKEISGLNLGLFFRADDSKCTFDGATGLVKAIEVNGEMQVPSLYPNETVLGPELLKIAK